MRTTMVWISAAASLLGCGTEPDDQCPPGMPGMPGCVETGPVGDGPTVDPTGSTGSGSASNTSPGTSAGTGTGMGTGADETSTTDPTDTAPIFDVAQMPDVMIDPPELEAVVYAHSSGTLYQLDPDTLALDELGPFVGCGAVVDIAVDRDNQVYASAGGIFAVDVQTVQCTLVSAGAFGNNLSFVPPGVLDPEQEILVTYSGTQYRSLDLDTGVVTDHGTIPWSVSGDIVSIKDGPTYVSVNHPDGLDHLLLVDPSTGAMISDAGPIATETSVYGLGYWGGTVYGFSSNGNITEITENMDGTITAMIIDNSAVSYWGAGSSTFAPLTPEG